MTRIYQCPNIMPACLPTFTLLFKLRRSEISMIVKVKTAKAMATHSSTLAWTIPWMKEPGRLQSMWSRRVRHDWATSLSLFPFPLQCSCLENPRDGGAWWAAIYGVTQSWTRLNWLSSCSSSSSVCMSIPISQLILPSPLSLPTDHRKFVFYNCDSICVCK